LIGIPASRSSSLFRLFFLALSLIVLACPSARAEDPDKTLNEVVSAAESMFNAMKNRDYPAIWAVLSATSRSTIVDETRKAIATSTGKEVPEEELRRDFSEGGPVARGYWNGFLEQFDPALALEQSKWEKGTIGSDRAEILIIYKTAEKPALLKLFRENGRWKAGLVETFWGRK